MRAVLQRVVRSSVSVVTESGEEEVGRIGAGLTILIGVADGDMEAQAERLAHKISSLRIFPDEKGRFDQDIREVGGAILAISQFTLLADTRRGRRPSLGAAARPEQGEPLYESVIAHLRAANIHVETGRFGAHMHVEILNDGPATIILDTDERVG